MRDNPLVSIVLPTYNGSRFLEQAIQSVLNQSYPEWELIIVDDASTDHAPDLIEKYVAADKRIRSVRHQTNRKLPATLNTGFAQANGVYLTWTSDDNCYRSEAIATMTGFLQSNPDADVVYTDYTVFDEAGTATGFVTIPPIEHLVNGNSIGPCFLYRRSVHEALGGYAEDLFLAEDYDFWLRASASFVLRPMHQDLYLYRKHSASLSWQQGARAWALGCESLGRNLPNLRWMDRKTRAAGYLRVAVAAQAHRDMHEVRRCVLQVIRAYPPCIGRPETLGLLVDSLLGHRGFLLLQRSYRVLSGFRSRPQHKSSPGL